MKSKIKKKQPIVIPRDPFRYKLTEVELDRMMFQGVISREQRDLLIRTSRLREPNYYANNLFQTVLFNSKKWGKILLTSVNFNGGEGFNEPYHFVAEIDNHTTPRIFKRFMWSNGIPAHPHKE